MPYTVHVYTEAEFLYEIQTNSGKPFIPATGHCKEKGGIPYRKTYPLLYGFRNPYRNLKSEKSQD
jgi:hypothetical protein